MAKVPSAAKVEEAPSPGVPSSGFPATKIAEQVQPSNTGSLIADVGAQLSDTFAAMREDAFDRRRKAALNETLVDLPASFERDLAALQDEAEPGAAGFADAAEQRLDATRKSFVQGLGEKHNLRASDLDDLEQRTRALLAPELSRAFRFEQTEQRRHFGESLGEQIESLALGVRREPTQGRIDLALTTAETAIANGSDILSPAQEAALRDQARRGIHLNALEGKIEADPAGTLKRLQEGAFDSLTSEGLTSDDFATLERQAEQGVKEERALLRGRVATALKDEIASVRRTGRRLGLVSEDDIKAAYDPDEAAGILRGLEDEKAFYATRQRILLTPMSEDLAIIQANAPQGEGFAAEAERQDMLIDAVRAKHQALAKDPAGYLFDASPRLAGALAAADTPEETSEAAAALLAAQERLGVPRFRRRVTSNSQASEIVAHVAGAGDGQARADFLRGQAALYGDHWPMVYGELVEAGLPGGAVVLAGMTRPGQQRAAVALAEAQQTGAKELRENLGKEAANGVAEQVQLALEDFDRTMALAPGGAALGNTYHAEIETLALLYVQQGQPVQQAAFQAAADVVNNHYTFHGTYRVPREHDGARIEFHAQRFRQRGVADLDLDLPPSFDERLDEAETKRQYLDHLATFGYWLTNQDETGLLLMNQQGETVTTRDGEPVELSFEELMQRPAVGAIDQGFTPGGSFEARP